MADLQNILEEDDSDNEQANKISLRDITSASKTKSQLRNRQTKEKGWKKKILSEFEKRFTQLALNNTLVSEKKRIDYILVHKIKTSSDEENDEDIRVINEQEHDRKKFIKALEMEGFTVQISTVGKLVYTKLHCPFKRLCREAERVKFEMPLKDCPKLDPVTETWFTRFQDKYFETDDQEDFISARFQMNKIKKFVGHENPNTFFRPAVRSFLTHHILINLNIDEVVLDDEKIENDTAIEEDQQSSKIEDKKGEEQPKPIEHKGLPYMLLKKNYIDSFVLHEESALCNLRGDNFILSGQSMEDTPAELDPRKSLDDTWTKPFKYQPLWKVRNYFGERIAFYFAWSGMLCTTLWIPTIFGMCVFFYGLYESITADDSPVVNCTAVNKTFSNCTVVSGASAGSASVVNAFNDLFDKFKRSFDNEVTPYFGLCVCVWGTVFLEIWKRKNAELAYEWDVEHFEANEPDRPSFTGTISKKDPVTEEYVWYYPFQRQCLKFCFSFSFVIFMIAIVVISVLAIITYRVFVDIDFCPKLEAAECLMMTTVLSSILNAISILLLSKVYNVLARILTEWENHRTQTRYDDALIFKLFAFQFVNSYASCFYIAFFRGRFKSAGFLRDVKYQDSCEGSCMTQLSFQILILMLMKPLPKFLKDVILVWVVKIWKKLSKYCSCRCLQKLSCCTVTNQVEDGDIEAAANDGKNRESQIRHLQFLKHEHQKPVQNDFTLDEYTEKIIQYGFLMLFATSFPLAPLLALLTNMFDLRVDAKRLLWWYRRPVALIAQDIGMWYQILLFVNFCGVVSNAFLIAFTSNWGSKYDTQGKLIIVIAFEHIVFSLKYIVAYLIPDVPSHVQLSSRREQYQIQKKMEEPNKDTDYSRLFPIEHFLNADEEDDDDDDGNGAAGDGSKNSGGLQSIGGQLPESVSKQGSAKGTHVTYLRRGGNQASDKAQPDLREQKKSSNGYVDMTEQERQARLNPTEDLWYCGQNSDSDGSASKFLKHSLNDESATGIIDSRHNHFNTSKPPQGRQVQKEEEAEPLTGLYSPTHSSQPEQNLFSNPRNQPAPRVS